MNRSVAALLLVAYIGASPLPAKPPDDRATGFIIFNDLSPSANNVGFGVVDVESGNVQRIRVEKIDESVLQATKLSYDPQHELFLFSALDQIELERKGRNGRIFLYEGLTGRSRLLSSFDEHIARVLPTIGPHGKSVIALHGMDTASSERAVMKFDLQQDSWQELPVTNTDCVVLMELSFSPDGTRCVMGDEVCERGVMVGALLGEELKIVDTLYPRLRDCGDFEWINDREIFFVGMDSDDLLGDHYIWKGDLDNETVELVLGGDDSYGGLTLSPDKRRLAYIGSEAARLGISILRLENMATVQVKGEIASKRVLPQAWIANLSILGELVERK